MRLIKLRFSYFLIGGMLSLSSCFVAKDYQRPEVIDEEGFRMDRAFADDTTTLADRPWQELFTDKNLVRLIDQALANNLDVRIAIQQIAASEAYFRQGKAGQIPVLRVGPQVTHQELSRNSQFGRFFDGGITQFEVSAAMSWEADIWGRIRSTQRAFEATYLQSAATHQAVRTELISRVAALYYQLLALDEQLALARETIANREIALETTKALKESGIVSEVGVKQTEAQLHTARALEVDLQLDIKLVENSLSILLGEGPQDIARGTFGEQEIQAELTVGVPMQLLRNRPDVLAAEFGLRNAFELTNVAKANFYPSLTLSATSGVQSLDAGQLFSVNSIFATFLGGITQPVLNGRRIRTQYEVALAQQEQALLNFRKTVLQASKEVSDALYAFEAYSDRIRIKQEEFDAYDIAITYSEELLDNGMANYLEVLTARENALNAELGLINAKASQLNAVVSLYRALGGGWKN